MQTGLAKLTGNKLMALSRGNETITFLLVMLVTSFIGAFVSNTGTVALMMPIIVSLAAASGMQSSRFLMPLAFAGLLFVVLGWHGGAALVLWLAALPCEGLFALLARLDAWGMLSAPVGPRPHWLSMVRCQYIAAVLNR